MRTLPSPACAESAWADAQIGLLGDPSLNLMSCVSWHETACLRKAADVLCWLS